MTSIRSEQDEHQPDLVLRFYYVAGAILVAMEIAVNEIGQVPALMELQYYERNKQGNIHQMMINSIKNNSSL